MLLALYNAGRTIKVTPILNKILTPSLVGHEAAHLIELNVTNRRTTGFHPVRGPSSPGYHKGRLLVLQHSLVALPDNLNLE